MHEQKALIAMSGGVDSSVAAHLMCAEGFTCIGATMRLFDNAPDAPDSKCCALEDVEDARAIAHRLGIPFYVFNFKDRFRQKVMDKFVQCYECGLTPNPCVDCNRYLKFQELLERAMVLDCDCIATGHYASIRFDSQSGRYLLYKAADKSKDQSYFLYTLTQAQLAHIRFPLGDLTKEQVRQIAEAQGFVNARKRDSQDICFVPDGDYFSFLKAYTGKEYVPGDFLDLTGKVVGHHVGAAEYTRGQRKGLGLAMGTPVYVCSKDMVNNTVTVGSNADLFGSVLRANDWNFFPFEMPDKPMRVLAKARSRMIEQPATIYPEENGFVRVEFDEPQRAITTGQAVVLYDGDQVIGGGTITEVL